MKKNRKERIRRSPKKLLRIYCEGEKGEVFYFKNIFNSNLELKEKYAAEIIKPSHNDPEGIVRDLIDEIKKLKKIDKVPEKEITAWAVFDHDTHKNIAQAFSLARESRVRIGYTNISFEFWILLHYEKTRKQFQTCDEVLSYIKKNHDSNFAKNENYYLKVKDKTDDAIENGKWLEREVKKDTAEDKIINANPYTTLHTLVEFLTKK